MRHPWLTTLAMLLVVAAGCSAPRSRVHGTVQYQGKPLAYATVVFLAPDNKSYPVQTREDGGYEIDGLPRGPIRVTVQAFEPRVPQRPPPGGKGPDPDSLKRALKESASRHVQIPPRYNDPNQSGLAFDLTLPDQEYAINLK